MNSRIARFLLVSTMVAGALGAISLAAVHDGRPGGRPLAPLARTNEEKMIEFRRAQRATARKVAAERERDARRKLEARREVDSLVAVRTWGDMLRTVRHWQRDLDDAQRKRVVAALAARLGSARPIRLDERDDMCVQSRVAAGKETSTEHIHLLQDVYLENGRCAWGIERLLGCRLPEFTEKAAGDREALARRVEAAHGAVIEAMAWPDRPELRIGDIDGDGPPPDVPAFDGPPQPIPVGTPPLVDGPAPDVGPTP